MIYGDGEQTRDFTYVDDVVDANRTLLTDDSVDGEVLNIGSSDNISIQELAEVVRDQLAPELEIEYESAREADAEHTHASVEKAEELIGYEPSRTITEGVGEFIEWYRENRAWYEPSRNRGKRRILAVECFKCSLAPIVNPPLSRPFGRVLRHFPNVALEFVVTDVSRRQL